MSREAVVERLGPPTRTTTLQETLSSEPNVVTIVEPSIVENHTRDEHWLYLNVPPGHRTRIVIHGGVVASVESVRDDAVVPAAPTAVAALLDEIVTAATALEPVTNDVIVRHYNLIETPWSLDGIFPGSMARIRANLAGVLSRTLSEGFEVSVKTLDIPLPCVHVNAIGPGTAATAGRPTWRACVVVKVAPSDGSTDVDFALYGHGALKIGDAWRRGT